jgi:very-short-patch-repair endonuclease
MTKKDSKLVGACEAYFGSYRNAIKSSGLCWEDERRSRAGKNNPMYGKKRTDDERKKMSDSIKDAYKRNPNIQTGSNNHMYGKTQTEESNKKRSASLLKYYSQFDGKRPYKLTKEGREKIIKSRLKAISSQKKSFTDIEKIMMKILDDEKIKYIFQYSFDYFCVDFYIPDSNLVIWCDGDYWHGKNVKRLSERQKEQIRMDKSQNSYLNNKGIKYIRFLGSEIKKDVNGCCEIIKKKVMGM